MNTKSFMNTKQKRANDITEWALTAGPVRSGPRCYACRSKPEVVAALKTLAEMRKRGETRATMPSIRLEFERRFGVTLGDATLQGHFANCLRTPWGHS